jgi:hypothetical protein
MILFCFEAIYSSGAVSVGVPSGAVAYLQGLPGPPAGKVRIALTDGRIFESREPMAALSERLAAGGERYLKASALAGEIQVALSVIYLVEQDKPGGPTTVHLSPSLKAPSFTIAAPLKNLDF